MTKEGNSPPEPPRPSQGKDLSLEEVERILLKQLAKGETAFLTDLWELASFYSHTGRQAEALKQMDRYLSICNDPEKQAGAYLALGQTMEQMDDHQRAVHYYSMAMSLEPEDTRAWYLINNNLGYCLNRLEQFEEAERYCRDAIQIDPERHNAYKNLGMSLSGQTKYAEAVRNYIQATQVYPKDGRAFKLLEELVQEHPEIADAIPDIDVLLQACQALISKASAAGE